MKTELDPTCKICLVQFYVLIITINTYIINHLSLHWLSNLTTLEYTLNPNH